MTRNTSAIAAALAMLATAACSRGSDRHDAAPALTALPSGAEDARVATPETPQDTDDPTRFQPLRSAAVKDAIHRALRSGRTERWQDGALAGYAVPSATTDRNGCRAVRYTVDQRAGAAYEAITACDATPEG